MIEQQGTALHSYLNRIAYALGWLNVVCALGAVAVSITTGQIRYTDLYNADTFQIPTLLRGLWQQGTLADWDLPVNPPLFPDGLLFGLLWLLIPNLPVTYVAYAVAQVLLLLIGLLWLLRQLFGRLLPVAGWLLLTATFFLLLLASGRHFLLSIILIAGHHVGVIVVLPWVLGLILRLAQGMTTATPPQRGAPWAPNEGGSYWRGRRRFFFYPFPVPSPTGGGLGWGKRVSVLNSSLALTLLTLLTAFSDSLFLVQVTLPLLLIFGAFALIRPAWRRLSLRLGGILLVASGVGQMVRLLVVGQEKLNRYYAPVKRDASWQAWQRWLTELTQQEALLFWYWVTAVSALLGLLCLLWLDGRRRAAAGEERRAALTFVASYLALAALFAVVAVLLAGNFFSAEHARYLLPTIYLPWLLGWPLLLGYLAVRAPAEQVSAPGSVNRGADSAGADHDFVQQRSVLSKSAPLQLGLSLFFASCSAYLLLTQNFSALAGLPTQPDATARCLDEQAQQTPLRNGMANYWQASYLSLLTKHKLNIVQVNPDLSIYIYNNNLRGYDEAFDFVLVDPTIKPVYRLDQAAIVRQFGPPASSFRCGNSNVLVYNRSADLPFQRHLKTQPARARFAQPGDSFTFYGSSLPSLIGGLGIGLSKAASEIWGNRSGELGMVALSQLPAGSYNFAIHAFADSANTGHWVVASQVEQERTVLAQGELAASGRQLTQGAFTLTALSDVVLDVLYRQGTLYLDKVELARAGGVASVTPTPVGSGQLTLLYPRPQSFLVHPQADFVWQWNGAPLAANQAFEVRIWHERDSYHYGAHDAAAGRAALRQIDDTYTLHLDLGGAYSLQQHGRGTYSWSVAVVTVEPNYQDLQIEAPAGTFFWEPE